MKEWQIRQKRERKRQFFQKGYGAFGHFQTLCSMSPYTRACLFQKEGRQTPAFLRVSLAFGEWGTPDTARNLRGFAVKFQTDGGIYDLLCQSLPVAPANSRKERKAVYQTFSRDPATGLGSPGKFWELAGENPGLLGFGAAYFSNQGTPYGFINMKSYGVQTQIWENWEKERFLVRYHWIPRAGERLSTREEALLRAGLNPDAAGEELYGALSKGEQVSYNLFIQIMPHANGNYLSFHPFDSTKTWPKETFPLRLVGRLNLEENPENMSVEVEPAEFSGENRIDGILPKQQAEPRPNREQSFRQIRRFLEELSLSEKRNLTDNLAVELNKLEDGLREETIRNFRLADSELGEKLEGRVQWYQRNFTEGKI